MKKITNHIFSILKTGFYLTLFSLLFFNFSLNAQSRGVVKGIITDATSGNPLPGANIIVVGQQIGTATLKDGSYQISLKPGNYNLQISYVSYKTIKSKVIVEAGKTINQDFDLSVDLVGTQEVIVLGSRRSDRTVVDSPVPIDVISAKEIEMSGLTQTTELLKMLVPSYNAPQNTITDGSDHVRPASLRGLGPDQVLVLVNGKRRYTSALVHVNGTIGRGSTGADLNAIPASAIDRIEVLRDGAAAQYGSDAIAGVINLVLKKRVGLDASISIGENMTTQERGYSESEGLIAGEDASTYSWDGNAEDVSMNDGLATSVHVGYGFEVKERGTVYISAEYKKHDFSNRAGLDPRQQYFDGDVRENSFNRLNHIYGDAKTTDMGVFLNGSIPLKDNLQFYAFGGYTVRDGLAGGFYRRARDNRTVRSIYPNGFLPKIATDIYDGSFSSGLKGNIGSWGFDVSETFGGNVFDFNVVNTLNTSMGALSPTEFFAGSLKFYQSTTNVDFVNQFDIGFSSPLNLATGLEYRIENYQIAPGGAHSYGNGGVPILDGPNQGNGASVGSQVFPGFSPANIQDQYRTNFAAYVDLENDILPNLTMGLAGRFEQYSDFGSTINGKLSARYELFDGFAIRGAASNGFRAPSLAQSYFTSIATVFINSVPFEVGTFPVSSPAAKALGAKDLDAEKSINISAGVTYSKENFSLTVDGYQISIADRIILSETFRGDDIAAFLLAKGIYANGGRYFTNLLDTKTTGVDVTARYGIKLNEVSSLKFTVAMNFNSSEITNKDEIKTPEEISTLTDTPLMGETGQKNFEEGQPKDSWNFMMNYTYQNIGIMVRALRFGEITRYTSWAPNHTQTYSPTWVTDVEVSYKVTDGINFAIGSNNILNSYPDKQLKRISFNGIFQYSGYSPSGYNGRFVYTRLNVRL